jgi:MFS family permease
MYPVGGWLGLLDRRRLEARRERPAVPANVIYLGLTSLLTDVSTEMVAAVLPVYMVGFLRLSPAQFGIVDGVYQGVSGVVQLASAAVTDRLRRYKEVAALGYAISACARVGLLLTAQWTSITGLLATDRLGKGIRTAPRDALISLSIDRENLGTAFGIHRAMDACGAMLGPVLAFLILRVVQDGFDVVFAMSLFWAVVGLAVLVFFTENRPPMPGRSESQGVVAKEMWAFLRQPGFRHLTLSTLLLSSMTIGDAFIYLIVQQHARVPTGVFPLLYVATSATFLVLAAPIGRLADHVGRLRVFVGGHVVLVAFYTLLVFASPGRWLPLLAIATLGLYYAATEGVLAALGSAMIPGDTRTSGLAVLATSTLLAKLLSSMIFGIVWTRFGLSPSVLGFAIGLTLAIVASIAAFPGELGAEPA